MKPFPSLTLLLAILSIKAPAQVWTSIGPSSVTGADGAPGRITSIAVDPTDPDHWLLGAPGGGVWESKDAGTAWLPLSDSQATLAIGSVAFAPGNPKIIYAGTGEANYEGRAQAGLGILKSSDGGANWTMLGGSVFARTSVGKIRVDPANPNTAVAVMSRANMGRNGEQFLAPAGPSRFGVQRTTDGGQTWTRTLDGENVTLEVDPTNFNNQYTASTTPAGFGAYASATFGVYRSGDGGKTWTLIPGPWSSTQFGRIILAISRSDRNVLYAAVQASNRRLLGLYRTGNAWATAPSWAQVSTTGNWNSGGVTYSDLCGNECQTRFLLAVDPTDPNTVYAGGETLWRCDNCGSTPVWTDIGSTLPRGKRCLEWSGARMIVCTDGGVFSTTTKSAPWRDDNGGLSVARFSNGALHPTDPDYAVAAALNRGAMYWTGTAWQFLAPYDGEVALSDARASREIMASSGAQVYRTTTGGPFAAAGGGLDTSNYNANRFLPVRKCPANDDVFLSGVTRLYRSNNFFSGATASWTANAPAGDPITAIAFAPSDNSCGTYAYGTATGRAYITADGGSTWTDLDPSRSIPARAILSLAFDPTSSETLYAAMGNLDQVSKPGHLFKTTRASSATPRWTDISPGWNLPHNVVAIDPANPDSIYVGTDAGVWYTSNGGSGWQLLGPATGLPNAPVYDLQINPRTGRIIAFTFGRGAWSLDAAGIPPLGGPPGFSAAQSLQSILAASYSQQLGPSGGGVTWSITSGALPTGLVLSSSGEITGAPLYAGVYTFKVNVRDANGGVASQTFTLTVGTTGSSAVWSNFGLGQTHSDAPSCRGDPSCLNSGRIASIAADPSDARHWLIGTGNGGIWETRDTGVSFRPISDAAETLVTGAVAFAPSDPKVIYVATGEATNPGFTKGGMGLLKSVDSGKTWTLLAQSVFGRASVRRIRVHPTNPNIVTATVFRGGFGRDAGYPTPSSPPYGVVNSTDGGVSWTRTLPGPASALEIHSSNFNNQYAAIGDRQLDIGRNVDAVDSMPYGLYRSTNAGQSWSPVQGPWGACSRTSCAFGRIELALSPSNPNTLYASFATVGAHDALFGIWRTDNAWAANPAWIRIPAEATGEGGFCGPEKCSYSHVISVDPSDPTTLFAGGSTNGFWRCDNCGGSPSWTEISSVPDSHTLTWSGQRLIVGNDHGSWSSLDKGNTWTNHNATLNTLTFYNASLHPRDPNFVLGGLRDVPPARIMDRGYWLSSQSAVGEHHGEGDVALSSRRPETDWMTAAPWGAVFRTTDAGQSAIDADAGIDPTGSAFVPPVRKCPANDDVFLMGSNRIWRIDNFFSSASPVWVPNGPPSPFRDSYNTPGTIFAIEFVPSDKTCNFYAYGNRGGELYLTRDGGKTWSNLDPNKSLPARPVNGIAFHPTDPNIAFVALSSFDNATPGKPGHVFKSTNAMSAVPSWVNISPPQDQPFNAIAVDPVNPLLVFAGSDIGLWRSNDAGATWTRQGRDLGLPPVQVYDIKINPNTGTTAVFTYGRGAFALGPELISSNAAPANDTPGDSVPGSWVQVQGANLAGYTRIWTDTDFAGLDGKLPTNLSGTEVRINGVPAAVYFISPTQITFQALDGISGDATIQVFRNGVPSNTITAAAVSNLP